MKSNPEPSTQEVLAGLVERVTFHNAGERLLRSEGEGARTPRALLQNPPSSAEMGPVRRTGAGHVGLQGASLFG